jgi:CheY-like chemotaxis protein
MNHPPDTTQGVGMRVLVIDDDPRVRAAMTAELTAVGWHPTALGPEWLRARDTDPDTRPGEDHGGLAAEFDVALVDVALPSVADGLALITRLVTELPVVAFSINGAAHDAALGAGAGCYLEKDGDTDRLLRALHVATSPKTQLPDPQTPSTGPRPPRSSR